MIKNHVCFIGSTYLIWEHLMPLIDSSNQEIKTYKGLHLYHFWLSSCSQRVRIVLAEKNLDWVDHVVDISPAGMQHATEEYQSINPQGLVPSLVHDGRVIIESIDIIDYLDEHYPQPQLRSTSESGKGEMFNWMNRADDAQHIIKTLTHEFLFKPERMSPPQLAQFLIKHKNNELREFMTLFCSEEGFPKVMIESELKVQHDEFVALDDMLKDQVWLVEDTFSLADIAWIPNVRRLDMIGYPLEIHPHLLAWFERFKQRASYQQGITRYEVPQAMEHFQEYVAQRTAEQTGVTSFAPLNKKA